MVADRHSDTFFVGTLGGLDTSVVLNFLCFGRVGVVLALARLGSLPDSVRRVLSPGPASRLSCSARDWRYGSGWCRGRRRNGLRGRDERRFRSDEGYRKVVTSNRRSAQVLKGRLISDLSKVLEGRECRCQSCRQTVLVMQNRGSTSRWLHSR